MLMSGKATKLSNLTFLPSFLQAHHPCICTSFLMFMGCIFLFFVVCFLNHTHAITYQGSVYKASDLLHRDHVCEKSDDVKLIDCP